MAGWRGQRGCTALGTRRSGMRAWRPLEGVLGLGGNERGRAEGWMQKPGERHAGRTVEPGEKGTWIESRLLGGDISAGTHQGQGQLSPVHGCV